ncbi:MAG: bacteriohemerythrin, partial [Pseudomonadota bacterium]
EVLPLFSPHPVETTTFLFRALWENGFRTYAHLADICRLEVLREFITDDPEAPGITREMYDRVAADMAIPAEIKKVDVGGGMIHGDAYDFREDQSGKIILAHTSRRHTIAQKAIGSTASFGTVDVLIPSNHDFIWRFANEFLQAYFPSVSHHHLRVLMNNPVVTFNPGTILIKERHVNQHIYLLLSGSVEAIPLEHNGRSVLSAGAMVGELSGLFGTIATETYRAVGFVKALDIPVSLYGEFVRRHQLFSEIARVLENREFLQRTWLFGEVVSTQTLNRIAQEMVLTSYAADETVDIGAHSVGLVARGSMGRFLGDHRVETLEPGSFFGEEMSIFWTPSMFRLRALAPTDVFLIPAGLVSDIPSVRWKLFEASGKRMTAVVEGEHDTPALLRWHEEYRVDILRIDNQHRRLFEQGNTILEAVMRDEPAADVLALVDALAEYARYHFGEEEAMMARHAYPDLDGHRLQHARLLDQLADMRDRLAGTQRPGEDEMLDFLRGWLMAHIVNDDRVYAPFMNERGVY